MRRHLVLVAAAATAAAVAWPAHAGTTRTVTRSYTGALSAATTNGYVQCCGVVVGGGNDPSFREQVGFTWTKVRPAERFARLTFHDRTGQPVEALLSETTSSGLVQLGTVCGGTTKLVHLAPGGGELVIRPSYGTCGTTPSVPTTGTVKVELGS